MSGFSDSYIIGIDGGGTGCRVAITSAEGRALGGAKGGSANPTFKPQTAVNNILDTLEAARLDAKLDRDAIQNARAFVGLAGVRNAEVADFITAALPMKQACVVEDRITTVTGALAAGDGAVAAIGTGSFLAHSSKGDTRYVGGWGFRMGDQASGAWLGHMLLRRVALCLENIAPHSATTRSALAHFEGDPNKVFEFTNTASPAEFGTLAPLVVEAAQGGVQGETRGGAASGDPFAIALMQEGADYISRALEALEYKANNALCLTGGLGPHYAAFLPPLLAANVVNAKGSALDGALLLAAQMPPPS